MDHQNPKFEEKQSTIPRDPGTTQTSGKDKVTNLDKNDNSKKTSSEQDNSILAKFGKKLDELRTTIISRWPKNPEEANSVFQDGSKSEKLERTSTISLEGVGPIRRWYLTSKSLLARTLRVIRRYFTLKKTKPVTPPKKSTETAENAAKVTPVGEVKTAVEGQTVDEANPVNTAHETVAEVPKKHIKPPGKARVTPVTQEMLDQALLKNQVKSDNNLKDHPTNGPPPQHNPEITVST